MLKNTLKVVAIEDDSDDFILLKDYLGQVKTAKYDVTWVSSYNEGIEHIDKQDADIYLIDYILGAESGIDILRHAYTLHLEKPIIMLTGLGDHNIDVEAMEQGASDFICKSNLSPDLLERSIRYSIKRAQDKLELRKMEKLKTEKDLAYKNIKSKSHFLAVVSHEIRNPLGAMIGYADLAMNNDISEEQRNQFLLTIKKSGEHLLDILNDFLDLSKIEAGQFQVQADNFYWKNTLQDVLELLQPISSKKHIDLTCNIDEKISEVLKSDAKRFRQILLNLIGNSLKFTEVGVVKVICSFEESTDSLLITIKDTGIGISLEAQKKLFTPYCQANLNCEGTGLGLDLSRKLARALGGNIKLIESSPGNGTTLQLALPGLFNHKNLGKRILEEQNKNKDSICDIIC